jgi:hypothetical protein
VGRRAAVEKRQNRVEYGTCTSLHMYTTQRSVRTMKSLKEEDVGKTAWKFLPT